MVANKANDETVITIQEIFESISRFDYAQAFFLSSEIMERNENGDQIFHEWVKALTEFFTCNRKYGAIELLEKIKPQSFENEMHFRIINSLIDFYRVVGDKDNFIKYKDIIYPKLSQLDNAELKHKIVYNIANGFYTFEDYEKSLKYSDESIVKAREKNMFNMDFSLSIMVKIMSLFYLGKIEEAEDLKEIFLSYLKVTGNLQYKEYLDEALVIFRNKGGV